MKESQGQDKLVNISLLLGLFLILGALYGLLSNEEDVDRAAQSPIAKALHVVSNSEVVVRPAQSLSWKDVQTGSNFMENDTVFVGPRSSLQIQNMEGTSIQVQENTLITMRKNKKNSSSELFDLEVNSGKVQVVATANSKPIRVRLSNKKNLVLQPGAGALIESSDRNIRVSSTEKGGAKIEDLESGKVIDQGDSDVVIPRDGPDRNPSSEDKIPLVAEIPLTSEIDIDPNFEKDYLGESAKPLALKPELKFLEPEALRVIPASASLPTLSFKWKLENKNLESAAPRFRMDVGNTQSLGQYWSIPLRYERMRDGSYQARLTPYFYGITKHLAQRQREGGALFYRITLEGTEPIETTVQQLVFQFAKKKAVKVVQPKIKREKRSLAYAKTLLSSPVLIFKTEGLLAQNFEIEVRSGPSVLCKLKSPVEFQFANRQTLSLSSQSKIFLDAACANSISKLGKNANLAYQARIFDFDDQEIKSVDAKLLSGTFRVP